MELDLGPPCPEALLLSLDGKRDAVVTRWLGRTLQDYAEDTSRFLLREKDRFHNPVGHALKEGLPALFDALLLGDASGDLESKLDAIIRMRAVQDFSATQAVSFVFLVKEIVRQQVKDGRDASPGGRALAAFESRVDRLALHAFNLFVQCREQISAIKARSAGRRTFVSERLAADPRGGGRFRG